MMKENESEDVDSAGRAVRRSLRRRISTDLAEAKDNLISTPKKGSKQAVLKTITEKEPKIEIEENNDDAASVGTESSSQSMRQLKVVLSQIDKNDIPPQPSVRVTRSRKSSTLTEENVATYSPSRRTRRASSVMSDDTVSTSTTMSLRTRSQRQTPSKETKASTVTTPRKTATRLSKKFEKADPKNEEEHVESTGDESAIENKTSNDISEDTPKVSKENDKDIADSQPSLEVIPEDITKETEDNDANKTPSINQNENKEDANGTIKNKPENTSNDSNEPTKNSEIKVSSSQNVPEVIEISEFEIKQEILEEILEDESNVEDNASPQHSDIANSRNINIPKSPLKQTDAKQNEDITPMDVDISLNSSQRDESNVDSTEQKKDESVVDISILPSSTEKQNLSATAEQNENEAAIINENETIVNENNSESHSKNAEINNELKKDDENLKQKQTSIITIEIEDDSKNNSMRSANVNESVLESNSSNTYSSPKHTLDTKITSKSPYTPSKNLVQNKEISTPAMIHDLPSKSATEAKSNDPEPSPSLTKSNEVNVNDDSENISSNSTDLNNSPKKTKTSGRKSVTILSTPNQSSQQSATKRTDTPYPDTKSQSFVDETQTSENKKKETSKITDSLDGGKLKSFSSDFKKLSESWNRSVRMLSSNSPYIDGFGIENKKTESDEKAKSAVIAARSRRERGSISSENEDDDEMGEEEENNSEKNEFIDNEAEEVDDEEDSMDEEERKYLEENEIVERGIDLGSENTEEDTDDNNDEENDSFIVSDEEEIHEEADSDDELDIDNELSDASLDKPKKLKKKFKRIIRDLDESDNENDVKETLDGKKAKSSIDKVEHSTESDNDVSNMVDNYILNKFKKTEQKSRKSSTKESLNASTDEIEIDDLQNKSLKNKSRKSLDVSQNNNDSSPLNKSKTKHNKSIKENSSFDQYENSVNKSKMDTDEIMVEETLTLQHEESMTAIMSRKRRSKDASLTDKSNQATPETKITEEKRSRFSGRRVNSVERSEQDSLLLRNFKCSSVEDDSDNEQNESKSTSLLLRNFKGPSTEIDSDNEENELKSINKSKTRISSDFKDNEHLNKSSTKSIAEDNSPGKILKTPKRSSFIETNNEENNKSDQELINSSSKSISKNTSLKRSLNQSSLSISQETNKSKLSSSKSTITDSKLNSPNSSEKENGDYISAEEKSPLNKSALKKSLLERKAKELKNLPIASTTSQANMNKSLPNIDNLKELGSPLHKKHSRKSLSDMNINNSIKATPLVLHINQKHLLEKSSTPIGSKKNFAFNESKIWTVEPADNINESNVEQSISDSNDSSLNKSKKDKSKLNKSPKEKIISVSLSVKNPIDEENNEQNKRKRNKSLSEIGKALNVEAILNRCQEEIISSTERKKKEKTENKMDEIISEEKLEKLERKKQKKAEKLEVRARLQKLREEREAELKLLKKEKQKIKESKQPETNTIQEDNLKLNGTQDDDESPQKKLKTHLESSSHKLAKKHAKEQVVDHNNETTASTSTSASTNSKILKQLSDDDAHTSIKSIKKKKSSSLDIASPKDDLIPTEVPKIKKRKRLNILQENFGFKEEPITPPKIQYGFKESPMTPVNLGFKIQTINSKPSHSNVPSNRAKKRKVAEIAEPVTLLPKPKWIVEDIENDAGNHIHKSKKVKPNKEIKIINDEGPSTQFRVITFPKTKKRPAISLIPLELMEFRKKNLYRRGIPRQDAKTLLNEKEKSRLKQKF